ncbi:unnamed protein product, partial [Prorocentrum cordatum]
VTARQGDIRRAIRRKSSDEKQAKVDSAKKHDGDAAAGSWRDSWTDAIPPPSNTQLEEM